MRLLCLWSSRRIFFDRRRLLEVFPPSSDSSWFLSFSALSTYKDDLQAADRTSLLIYFLALARPFCSPGKPLTQPSKLPLSNFHHPCGQQHQHLHNFDFAIGATQHGSRDNLRYQTRRKYSFRCFSLLPSQQARCVMDPQVALSFFISDKERVGLLRTCIVTASLARMSFRLYPVAISASEASSLQSHLFTAEKHTHHRDSSAQIGWSTPIPAHTQAIFPHQLALHQTQHWQPMA